MMFSIQLFLCSNYSNVSKVCVCRFETLVQEAIIFLAPIAIIKCGKLQQLCWVTEKERDREKEKERKRHELSHW